MNPQVKTFKSGTYLFHENDRSRELYILQSGNIKIYKTVSGREVELAILGKGAVFGEMALIDGRARSASARALDDCSVAIVDADSFHQRVTGVPSWFMTIIKMTCQKIRNANRQLQTMRGGGRGINIILALQYEFLRWGDMLDTAQTRKRIGLLLGALDQSVVRTLEFLQQQGFVEYSEKTVRLADRDRLSDYCEYLRLFKHKRFEQVRPPSEHVRRVLMALVDKQPSIVRPKDGQPATTEMSGKDFWQVVDSLKYGSRMQELVAVLEDLGLITTEKNGKETGDKAEGGENPLSSLTVVINNSQCKLFYLYFLFKGVTPNL